MAVSQFRDLSPLLSPRSIAVVGASPRQGSAGRLVLDNLRHLEYAGSVYAVHPRHDEVLGYPCFPDMSCLPGSVDCVAVLLSAGKVIPTLQAAVAQGARSAWVLASGFAEAGPEGRAMQDDLAAFAAQSGLLVCGPNCIGVADLVGRSATYSVALSEAIRPGRVSAVVQSGAVGMGLVNAARFGYRYVISSGNEAVLHSADYLGYLAGDPHTDVVIAFIEGIRSPQRFVAAAQVLRDAGKPLLVVKVGRSESARQAVQAHTGSLAGSDAVIDAVFRHLGIVRLDTLDELLEAAVLFSIAPQPEGQGIGLLSLSGGQIGLIADLAEELSLCFPGLSQDGQARLAAILPAYSPIANPLDAWGSGDLERTYPACVEVVSQEKDIHTVAVSRDTPPEVAGREVEQSLAVAGAAVRAREQTGKPVVMFSNVSSGFHPKVERVLRDGSVPYLQGTRETLKALQAFARYAEGQRASVLADAGETPSPSELPEWRERLTAARGSLSEIEARQLLTCYGIQGPREGTAATADQAVALADTLGYPVVLKILSPDIQHKTEIRGVRVGLADGEAVVEAYQQIVDAAKQHHPQARVQGVLVQEMVPSDAVEVILGIVRDPEFGPVVVFGSGGILVELMKDSVLRVPPLSRMQALEMIHETRGAPLLEGYRGRPRADIDALAGALVSLSHLALDVGDLVRALDINPLMVLPEGQGVRAVDALVELG